MSKFRVVTPKGASFTVAGGGYDYEREALDPIGAEIVEAPANEAEFIAAARTADAIYAKGMPMGTLLAFMMATVALSLPEMILLRRVLKPRLIATFAGVTALGIIAVGYLFNAIL